MILVFTSTAFTKWVHNHVAQTADANFNPYLSFLFFCLYVALRKDTSKRILTSPV